VVCTKLDRFGRSVPDLVASIQQLDACGVRFLAIGQNLDTDASNPTSRLLLNILCCVSEFERSLINEEPKAMSVPTRKISRQAESAMVRVRARAERIFA
jgi:DNA invertase Pin-like site-specific DNA recombinase